jgi:hypothetical protein
LDLPWQTLSEVEFHRAVAFFRDLGVIGTEHDLLDKPGGTVVGQQFAFNMAFRSIEPATEVALGVFERVYQLPRDGALIITEG